MNRKTSQVRSTRTAGQIQPKRAAIGTDSWATEAQAKFIAQPDTTAIPAAPRLFKRTRDVSSQNRTTGSTKAVIKRAVAMNVPCEP
jgi:hypothetical protein